MGTMAELSQEQREWYLNHSANCPFCHSGQIEGGSVEIDAGGAWQEVSCVECGEQWVDIYKLIDVS
jgi:transcription elongation factor Elf1